MTNNVDGEDDNDPWKDVAQCEECGLLISPTDSRHTLCRKCEREAESE